MYIAFTSEYFEPISSKLVFIIIRVGDKFKNGPDHKVIANYMKKMRLNI